ncbi:MAG TPA: hypothetical protein VLH08_09925 [Acidobacteriota bacterium]|jgi:hypothetical protein|nr:hypothetical protein [Acidobacteriota bacterium]
MTRDDNEELPYFDSDFNTYVQELRRNDAYVRRGGKLSAPQMIKYENRVMMLVERLVLIHEAVKPNHQDCEDFLKSIEHYHRRGLLPKQVYQRFKEKNDTSQQASHSSERDRDRFRVITGGAEADERSLSDLPVETLLEMNQQGAISNPVLFHEMHKRERTGVKLPKMGASLWGKYRTWVAEKKRARRHAPRNHDR